MKTNHQRNFVENPASESVFFSGTKKLASGKAITIRTGGCESHHNAAQHKKHGAKKALRQAERRDGKLVILEQSEEN